MSCKTGMWSILDSMFKTGEALEMNRSFFIIGLMFLLVTSPIWAGNASLSQTQAVPAGERVANYLQAVVQSEGDIINFRNKGDVFSGHAPHRFSFNYDPDQQVIDGYVIGDLDDVSDIEKMLDLTRKIVLSLNKKIQKYYGVKLEDNDLVLDYFNVKIGQEVVKYTNGQYIDNGKNLVPTPTPVGSLKMQEP